MLKFLRILISPVVDLYLIPWLLGKVIRTATDRQRAETIEIIARAAAAQIVAEHPNSDWAMLFEMLVTRLGDQLPTDSKTVLQRAAKAALIAAGVKPTRPV